MKQRSQEIRKLIRELELGKKKLRLEYNKGVRALEDAIRALQELELSAKPQKRNKNSGTLNKLITEKSGARGRSSEQPGLTQMLADSIRSKRQFVHQRDLVTQLLKKFPDEDKELFSRKVSVLLSVLKSRGRLVTINKGGYRRNMYWGLPQWLNAEGRVVKGFDLPGRSPSKKSGKK